ncbi:MAG: acyl-CoA dehydrogenase, partial [Rhodospirillales bacterium]|nr:acyl-CoA dehydrogenase [Rhodospirillales bacterium]
LMLCGSPAQQQSWLPRLARGEVIGTLAWAEGAGNPRAAGIGTAIDGVVEAAGSAGAGMRLSGRKLPVPDGMIADFAIVVARDGGGAIRLVLVELAARGVARTRLATIDPTRDHAAVDFAAARGECLAVGGWSTVETVLERAAILTAFEQIGGASACLDMATAYARERHAFGRPIGSFQAIKHKLADVYIALELARSNAYFGAWALQAGAADLPLAAASARVAACEAFHLAAKESIQTHGGMGFTWEADCHLYYRRAACLALGLGSAGWWKDRLVTCLETRNAA